jgi:hypothetical protein
MLFFELYKFLLTTEYTMSSELSYEDILRQLNVRLINGKLENTQPQQNPTYIPPQPTQQPIQRQRTYHQAPPQPQPQIQPQMQHQVQARPQQHPTSGKTTAMNFGGQPITTRNRISMGLF